MSDINDMQNGFVEPAKTENDDLEKAGRELTEAAPADTGIENTPMESSPPMENVPPAYNDSIDAGHDPFSAGNIPSVETPAEAPVSTGDEIPNTADNSGLIEHEPQREEKPEPPQIEAEQKGTRTERNDDDSAAVSAFERAQVFSGSNNDESGKDLTEQAGAGFDVSEEDSDQEQRDDSARDTDTESDVQVVDVTGGEGEQVIPDTEPKGEEVPQNNDVTGKENESDVPAPPESQEEEAPDTEQNEPVEMTPTDTGDNTTDHSTDLPPEAPDESENLFSIGDQHDEFPSNDLDGINSLAGDTELPSSDESDSGADIAADNVPTVEVPESEGETPQADVEAPESENTELPSTDTDTTQANNETEQPMGSDVEAGPQEHAQTNEPASETSDSGSGESGENNQIASEKEFGESGSQVSANDSAEQGIAKEDTANTSAQQDVSAGDVSAQDSGEAASAIDTGAEDKNQDADADDKGNGSSLADTINASVVDQLQGLGDTSLEDNFDKIQNMFEGTDEPCTTEGYADAVGSALDDCKDMLDSSDGSSSLAQDAYNDTLNQWNDFMRDNDIDKPEDDFYNDTEYTNNDMETGDNNDVESDDSDPIGIEDLLEDYL